MKQLKVLLIEDSAVERRVLRQSLVTLDTQVDIVEADRLEAGLGILKSDAPDIDVVILDLGLIDSFGLDSIARIKQTSAQLPIVVLTGYGHLENAVKAIHCGADDYWKKPVVDFERFVWSLTIAIERRKRDLKAGPRAEFWWKDPKTVALITALAGLIAALAKLIWGT